MARRPPEPIPGSGGQALSTLGETPLRSGPHPAVAVNAPTAPVITVLDDLESRDLPT